MNECADCADSADASKVTIQEPNADDKMEAHASSAPANTVTVSATSTTVITSASSATNDSLPPAEALWNQFLKNISQQSARCKYPNPEVPEFYPRSATVARVAQSTSTTSSSGAPKTDSAAGKSVRIYNKSELIKRVTTNVSDLGVFRGANKAEGELTRYYWSFHDVSSEYIPHCLNFNVDLNGAQLKYTSPAIEYGDGRVKSSASASAAKSTTELSAELAIKNQQLAHLNNVVKALLEEIWKINELSTRQKNCDQWKNDMSFAINEFLKPTTELGFHCDDCCDRLKEFVTRVSKQLEHKIAKQHTQYKNSFVDSILAVVENSLRTLSTTNEDLKGRLLKHDVYTQTLPEEMGAGMSTGRPSRMDAGRRSKLQITKVYRNRNFYKCYDGHEMAKNQWYTAPTGRGEQAGGRSARFVPPAKSYSFQSAQHGDAQNPINPIQLIHQKYKNLNCRLEGIPDKNMVKFSYIVNGREYSAVASTKKEAQYHCAWHVLGASSQE